MAFERVQPCPRDPGPDAEGVVEGRAGEQGSRGREGDVVDLLLVAVQPGQGFRFFLLDDRSVVRWPEEDSQVIARRHEALLDPPIQRRGTLVALQGFGALGLDGRGHARGGFVVVIGCPERMVRRQRDAVDPVRVACQRREQDPLVRIPDLDGLVLGGGVELLRAAPAHAGDRGFVSRERVLDALGDRVPDADGGVLGGGCQAWEGWGRRVLAVVGLPG